MRARLLRAGLIALAVLIVAALAAAVILWRTVRPGELLVPNTLAGPDTVVLVSFDLTREDSGLAAALSRLLERDAQRKTPRLPHWARWLLRGGNENTLSRPVATLMPVRLVFAVDRPAGGDATGGLAVSLSRYSPRLPDAMGARPDPLVEGLPVLRPERKGDVWTGLLRNNVLLSRDADGLRALAARIGGRTVRPGALFEAVSALIPPGGHGFGIVLNPGDRLERLAHDALGHFGVEAGQGGADTLRLLPADLLGAGFSVELTGPDEAHVAGTVLFGDSRAAADGEEWVRRVLPVSLAVVGLESRFTVRRDGERLAVEGNVLRVGRLWDRLLGGH